ncbi:MAG: endonuclease/exonuclease/phosphatase family protein [Clostridia bacterium]|nr:endonuclease/exonuclease/phosphatase family protein [Clostridia bacterium]
MKKYWISAILLCGIFVSCGNGESHDTSISETEETAVQETLSVTAEMLAEYEVIRPEYASEKLIRAASSVYQEVHGLNDAVTFRHDFYREGVDGLQMGECEILIGDTNRPQSREFLASLRADDYGFAMIDKCIVIAGHTDENTALAAQLFLETVNNAAGTGVFYDSAMDTVIRGEYAVDSFSINGVPVREYEILFGGRKFDEAAAEKLREKIADQTGFVLNVTDESEGEYVLYVGEEGAAEVELSADHADGTWSEYSTFMPLTFTGNGCVFYGEDKLGAMNAVLYFEEMIEGEIEKSEERSINIVLPEGGTASPAELPETLKAMSFNVLYKDAAARSGRVIEIIRNYSPDTFGVQEASPTWMTKLRGNLRDEYDYVGFGRDGGNQGEYNAIFYKKDVFDLIDSGTKYLSDTPDRKSKVPESSLNRIYTYALLETKSDGEQILFVNTHFDHTNDIARTKQAKVLADFLKANAQYPIVLSGDFNTAAGTTAYEEILDGGVENSMDLAQTKETGATYTNYGKSKSVIDFIFVNEEDIFVESYRVCGEKIDGEYPSDHHPVLIEYVNCN